MWGVIGAIVGARLFHVIDQWDFYARDPISILKVNEGGLAIYGTIVGGPIAGALYAWRKGLNVARLADIAAPPLILGMAIGRIGDIINGEHHGAHARVPAGGRLHQPEHAGRDRRPGPSGGRLRDGAGPGDLRRAGVAGARLRPRRDGRLALQLGAALSARRHAVLDRTLCIYSLGRFFIQFYRRGHAVRAGPEPGAAAVGPDARWSRSGCWSSSTTARGNSARTPAYRPGRERCRRRAQTKRSRPSTRRCRPERAVPTVPADRLHRIGSRAAGRRRAPPTRPRSSCSTSIDANLAGHDSHGIIQIPTYIDRIQVGHIVPGAPWTIDPGVARRRRSSTATGASATPSPSARCS